ncbi:MAG TPA: hypothetical protein VFX59_26030, partial [Polyangiales bacterium]|nr:hypothetical protein [Polyangiales bacterium]
MATKKKAPWERPTPGKVQKRGTKHLTSGQKKKAAARAKRAGRTYPNMVDNMHEAQASKKKPTKKKAAKKKTAAKKKGAAKKKTSTERKSPRKKATRRTKAPEKDPRGGLTAAGR